MNKNTNLPKIPKRFILTNLIKYLKEDEIAYIDGFMNLHADENGNLWVSTEAKFEKEFDESEFLKPFLGSKFKIQKKPNGIKLWLYHSYEMALQSKEHCKFKSECEKPCMCDSNISTSFKFHLFKRDKDWIKSDYLPVVEFDEPLDEILSPQYLDSLNQESVRQLTDEKLMQLLDIAINDELYEKATLLRNEIESRNTPSI
jgi:hypothetical protein